MDERRDSSAGVRTARRRGSRLRLVVGVLLILAAAAHYIRSGWSLQPQQIVGQDPDPIRVPDGFSSSDHLPLEPGALAGCNLLLISVDTTRADRLGCYGNASIQTPAMDRLAREGVIFSAATATAPTTMPSHASILTGRYPARHGVRVNGIYRLKEEQVTLAERLGLAGYTTGAVISAYVLDSRFGLAQGFEQYDDDLSDEPNPKLFQYKQRRADRTTDRALVWLREAQGETPFFLWTHYFDPHATYDPPEPFAQAYANKPYDGEIAFLDTQIARLHTTLDDLDISDRTLVVLVGDHGDSLGQHNEITHAFLAYEATLRVPLLMRCGDRLSGVHVTRRASQVDIVPTVLSLLGLPAGDALDGIDLTATAQVTRPIYCETLHGMMVYGWAALLGVYDGDYKYIHGPRPELFNLSEDPNEGRNIIDREPQVAAVLKNKLVGFFGSDLQMAKVAGPTETLSFEDIQKLGALGYATATAKAADPARRPNPADMMPVMHRVEQVMYSDVAPTVPEKIDLLEAIVADYPDFHPALRFLGDMYRLAGDGNAAVAVYERSREVSADPTTLCGMALAKLSLGRSDEAALHFREIVVQHADHLPARYFLGSIAAQSGDFDEAIAQYLYIVNTDDGFEPPGLPPASIQLVQVYVSAGRGDEVPGVLEPALEANPRSASLRVALAAYLVHREAYADAERLLREGLELEPGDRLLVTNLASLLVGCTDESVRSPYEGIRLMEQLNEQKGYADPVVLSGLSLLYAYAGRLEEALSLARRAKTLAVEMGDIGLVQSIEQSIVQIEKYLAEGGTPLAPMFMREP